MASARALPPHGPIDVHSFMPAWAKGSINNQRIKMAPGRDNEKFFSIPVLALIIPCSLRSINKNAKPVRVSHVPHTVLPSSKPGFLMRFPAEAPGIEHRKERTQARTPRIRFTHTTIIFAFMRSSHIPFLRGWFGFFRSALFSNCISTNTIVKFKNMIVHVRDDGLVCETIKRLSKVQICEDYELSLSA